MLLPLLLFHSRLPCGQMSRDNTAQDAIFFPPSGSVFLTTAPTSLSLLGIKLVSSAGFDFVKKRASCLLVRVRL